MIHPVSIARFCAFRNRNLFIYTHTKNIRLSFNSVRTSNPSKFSKITPSQISHSHRSLSNHSHILEPELKYTHPSAFTPSVYHELSKSKLAALVVLTTMVGYSVAPAVGHSLPTLLYTTIGTWFCVSSANSFNQFLESPYDAQMSRTRNRVLVRSAISQPHAFFYAVAAGTFGTSLLYFMVNPITAVLGFSNIILYAFIYTPLKRISIANTWVGAIVGAIPPMMGWTAVTANLMDPAPWLLGSILYAWQFPHFNALSWNLRPDYAKAGYFMTSVVNPDLNARVALRYSLSLFPICFAIPYIGLTSWYFMATSSVVNLWMTLMAVKFWREKNEKNARSLFFSTLIHLPVVMALLIIHKLGDYGSDLYIDNLIEEKINESETK